MRTSPLAGRWPVATAVIAALAALMAATTMPSTAFAADPCPNAAIRAQQHAEHLTGCRAYEQVSERQKLGHSVHFGYSAVGMTAVSPDGDSAVYSSWGAFADAPSGMAASYRARRTADGWSSRSVSPPPSNPYHVAVGVQDPTMAVWAQASLDLDVGFLITQDYFDPTDANGVYDLYRRKADGSMELASRGNGDERTVVPIISDQRFSLPAVSTDGSHALFVTEDHLVPQDSGRVTGTELYDRANGTTHLVNQKTGGGLIGSCGSQAPFRSYRHMISADNSKIFFEVPSANGSGHPDCDVPRQVYARIGHSETIQVSASQRTIPDPTQPAHYEGASTDGDLAFFYSDERLTDEVASGGLYRYTFSTGNLDLIVPADAFPSVTKISGDGSHVYFISNFDLAPGGVFGDYNLYVWSEDGVRFIAGSPEVAFISDFSDHERGRTMVVTPGGEHLLFSTTVNLTSFDTGGNRQVYLYSAAQERLTCISCDPAGQRPSGSGATSAATMAPGNDDDRAPSITADGSTAVFETADQLVPEDTDGSRDVYEFTNGRLHLVSNGRGVNHALLIGMSAGGRDVFFTTPDPLSSTDKDGDTDVYVARRGGGFPEDPPQQAETRCDGDGCQGTGTSPRALPLIATEPVAGRERGDTRSRRAAKVTGRRSVRGSLATLRVTVPVRGRIEISGRGLRPLSRIVPKAGTYRVELRLSRRATGKLRKARSVRVGASVRFTPRGGSPSLERMRLTFRSRERSR